MAAAASLLFAASADAAQRRCAGRDLAADAKGRIYTHEGSAHACLRIRDRPIRIGRDAKLPRVSSPYAAAAASGRVRVIDMRNGSRRSAAGRPTDLVLSRHGVAAFMAGTRVQRLSADGSVTQLGEGTPGSLALAFDGTRLYWLKDGVPQTASLAAVAGAARSCPTFGLLDIVADARGRIYQNNDYEIFACLRANGR